jgi:hypothetical protein
MLIGIYGVGCCIMTVMCVFGHFLGSGFNPNSNKPSNAEGIAYSVLLAIFWPIVLPFVLFETLRNA